MSGSISNLVTNHGIKPINPTQCGYEACEPSHDYGPAARYHWLLHFVVSGKGVFETARGKYELSAGDVFIIRPYEITYYKADERKPWEYYWIGFTSDIPMPHVLVSSDVIHAPSMREVFVSAFSSPDFRDADPSAGAYEHYLCGSIWQIVGYMLSRGKAADNTAEVYVQAAISVIESEYSSGITVTELADRLHLNRSYFTVIFRQITGISPHKYLTDYRMRMADELLDLRGYTVGITALSVGYPDVFAFSRAYKRHYGHPPSRRMTVKGT